MKEIIKTQHNKNYLKTILLVVLGLVIAAGTIYTGMQISKKQTKSVKTTNWKTYTDKHLFYQIEYPESWYLVDHDQGSIAINTFPKEIPMQAGLGAGQNDISIGISIKGEIPSLEDYIKRISEGKVIKEREIIKIGDYSAIKIIYNQEAEMPVIFFSSGKYIITANVYWGSESVKKQALDKLNQILSTFKFIDQNLLSETSNWKTYTNLEAKFSINYPPDWQWKIDTSNEDYKRLVLEGKEGEVLIDWGNGIGGACPSGYKKLRIKNETIDVCHTIQDKSENWSLSLPWSLVLPNKGVVGYGGFATAKAPNKTNREVILKILSTLSHNSVDFESKSRSSGYIYFPDLASSFYSTPLEKVKVYLFSKVIIN